MGHSQKREVYNIGYFYAINHGGGKKKLFENAGITT